MANKPRDYSCEFKTKVVLEILHKKAPTVAAEAWSV